MPTSGRKSVKTTTSTGNRNNIKVLSTGIIGTVDNGTGRKTETHSEFVSGSTTTSYIVRYSILKSIPRLAAIVG